MNGNCKITLEGHTRYVNCICVWRDTLFSGSYDYSIIKWNDSSISQQLKQHTSTIMSLVVFNDHLWSGGYDRVMIEWDWNCNVIRKFKHTSAFHCLTVFDNMIFSGHREGSIIGWIDTRILPSWNPSNHHLFPSIFKDEVKLLLILSLIDPIKRTPKHPSCLFYKLPRDLLYYLFQFLSQ